MGCVPGFEYDLFVSYAHIDDAPDVGRELGWVATLKDNLKTRLDRRLGIRSNIWMDQRLVAESQLSAPILEGLQRSAGLLVVLSRAYLNSPWCARERGGFLDGLLDRRSLRRPLFIVECDDLEHERLPEAFRLLRTPASSLRAASSCRPTRSASDRASSTAIRAAARPAADRSRSGPGRSASPADGSSFRAWSRAAMASSCSRPKRSACTA